MEAIFYRPGQEDVNFSTGRKLVPELQTFFIGMADPSLDQIHSATIGFSLVPLPKLEQIKSSLIPAIYDRENYQKALSIKGIPQNVSEQIARGAQLTGKVVDDVIDCFDRSTNLPYGDIDWTKIARKLFENLQVDKGESELMEDAHIVMAEPNINKRARLARNLQEKVLAFVNRFNVQLFEGSTRDKSVEPTWSRLSMGYLHAEIDIEGMSRTTWALDHTVTTVRASLARRALEGKISKLPPIDQERREELRMLFGAKAANLIILSEIAEKINNKRKILRPEIKVPEFKVVPANLYNLWKEGQDIDQELLPYYDWVSSLRRPDRWGDQETDDKDDYIVRSSAVYSEDGEEITGAGIYESVVVSGGSNFEGFKEAISSVYTSTDSKNALAYRKLNGIPKEEMGLVIQRLVGPETHIFRPDGSGDGYVNTRLPGVPGLMEIKTGRSRNFIKRKELDYYLALDDGDDEAFSSVHQFEPDLHKVWKNHLVRIAQVSSIIEKVWGHPVQLEFLARGLDVNVVQVRDIPKNLLESTQTIEFPDEPEIHSGESIGVGDMVLDVLDSHEYNANKRGAVVFGSNHMFSNWGNYGSFPKSGAVIIAQPHGDYGHIQTLCAEKGLTCIYPSPDFYERPHLDWTALDVLRKVRVVSNGMEARLYQIPGETFLPERARTEEVL